MKYQQFTIRNYRAITGPLTIDVGKPRLTPIVGVNESGKTTVLHALFAFDHFNDEMNDNGRHLRDTANLYRINPPVAEVAAVVVVDRSDLQRAFSEIEKENAAFKSEMALLRKRRKLPQQLTITRNLGTREYRIDGYVFGGPVIQNAIARELIAYLPYTLFFDDFRDKVDEKIEIKAKGVEDAAGGWLAIFEQLFKQTDKGLSVFQVPGMEARQRKSVIAKVQRHLNDTLTREWQNFRLDDRDALEIALEYEVDPSVPNAARHYIKLNVVETDSDGDKRYFNISDRSKGFYWFFNFVMKLEFNPKVVAGGGPTIYLLDEPGSYLHAFAQRKLCAKLQQLGQKNRVFFCTHSHYLLEPDTISVSSIVVAEKDGNGRVALLPIHGYKGSVSERRSALQPVLDALHVRPFALDLIGPRVTVITEGIYDHFVFEMFRNLSTIVRHG